MFRNVLVGVDGKQGGRDAIALAKQLASPEARTVLANIYGFDWMSARKASLALLAERSRAEQLLEREQSTASVDAELVVSRERPVGRGLHMLAEQLNADLIVVGSSRHALLGRVLMGDDSRATLNGAPCAIAIAPREYRHVTHELTTLGVGYDGSPESERAVAAARELAARNGAAAIRALRVIPLLDEQPEEPIPARWSKEGERLMHQALDRLRELGGDVAGSATYGAPGEELARFGEQLDLLLVGSRGYGPIGRLFHGSVSDYLVRHAPCPLLVLPRSSMRESHPSVRRGEADTPVATHAGR